MSNLVVKSSSASARAPQPTLTHNHKKERALSDHAVYVFPIVNGSWNTVYIGKYRILPYANVGYHSCEPLLLPPAAFVGPGGKFAAD